MRRAERAQLRKDLAWVRKNVRDPRDDQWLRKFPPILLALAEKRTSPEELGMTSPNELDELIRIRASIIR